MKRSLKDYFITVFLIVLCLWSISVIFNPSLGKVRSIDQDLADAIHREMGSAALLEEVGLDSIESQRKPVVVFVTSWCGVCHALLRKLKSENIAYVSIDVEKNKNGSKRYQHLLSGSRGAVPTTLVGSKIFVGDQSIEIVSASKAI